MNGLPVERVIVPQEVDESHLILMPDRYRGRLLALSPMSFSHSDKATALPDGNARLELAESGLQIVIPKSLIETWLNLPRDGSRWSLTGRLESSLDGVAKLRFLITQFEPVSP